MRANLDKKAIGQRIREARAAAGYVTQKSFADAVGCNPVTANKWEGGETLPSTQELVKISKLVGVSMDELLHGSSGGQPVQTEDLLRFFETPEGKRLTGEQRYGLARLLAGVDHIDEWKLKAAVSLLLGDKKEDKR